MKKDYSPMPPLVLSEAEKISKPPKKEEAKKEISK